MKHTTHSVESARGESVSRVQPLSKGMGWMEQPLSAAQIAAHEWNLLREDLSLPTAVLYQDKLAHNLQWMQKFAIAY